MVAKFASLWLASPDRNESAQILFVLVRPGKRRERIRQRKYLATSGQGHGSSDYSYNDHVIFDMTSSALRDRYPCCRGNYFYCPDGKSSRRPSPHRSIQGNYSVRTF